jgi:hypothetical protein
MKNFEKRYIKKTYVNTFSLLSLNYNYIFMEIKISF